MSLNKKAVLPAVSMIFVLFILETILILMAIAYQEHQVTRIKFIENFVEKNLNEAEIKRLWDERRVPGGIDLNKLLKENL